MYGRWWFDRAYQLPPYSLVDHILDGRRNMKGFYRFIWVNIYLFYIFSFFFSFFFFTIMAFGVLLCIDCLMAAVAHFAATWLIFFGWGISFPVKTFSVFPHFPRQNLLISLAFPFLISPSSVQLVSPLLACFTPTSQFSPQFPVTPPIYAFFPFWILLASVSFKFFLLSVLSLLLTEWCCSSSMVDNFEVRRNCPSVAFLFARLRGLMELFSDPLGALLPNDSYPQVEEFVSRGSGLGLALGVLYPLLLKSQVWFWSVRGILRRESMGLEERSSDLERGLSSTAGEEGAGVDTATTVLSRAPSSSHSPAPAVIRPFHALKENCSLKIEVFSKFKDRF